MDNISNFLLERGYKIAFSTIVPKGRGKCQFTASTDVKPIPQHLKEFEEKYSIQIIKCNFRKGSELTILMREVKEQKTKLQSDVVDISLDGIVDMLFGVSMSRAEFKDKLSKFENSAYTKGFNAHKKAMEKIFTTKLNTIVPTGSNSEDEEIDN